MIINVQVGLAEKYFSKARYWEAATHYKKVISALRVLADNDKDLLRKDKYEKQIKEYLERTRPLEQTYDTNTFKSVAKLAEKVICHGPTSMEYFISIFSKHCSVLVQEVVIFENAIDKQAQIDDLLKVVQVFMAVCPRLCYIKLKCKKALPQGQFEQLRILQRFQEELALMGFNSDFELMDVLHSLKIVLNTGTVFCLKHVRVPNGPHQPKISARCIEVWTSKLFPGHEPEEDERLYIDV